MCLSAVGEVSALQVHLCNYNLSNVFTLQVLSSTDREFPMQWKEFYSSSKNVSNIIFMYM